jgi:hypothetical protein
VYISIDYCQKEAVELSGGSAFNLFCIYKLSLSIEFADNYLKKERKGRIFITNFMTQKFTEPYYQPNFDS